MTWDYHISIRFNSFATGTEIDIKYTCGCSPTKSDLNLAGLSLQCQGDCWSPKPQHRWSFPQICLHTVASSNQQLHIFSQFSLIVLIMPRPTPIGIRHKVLSPAREGLWQSFVAVRVGLTRVTMNPIFRRHATTGTLVPSKSQGASLKTTSHQDLVRDKIWDFFCPMWPWNLMDDPEKQ